MSYDVAFATPPIDPNDKEAWEELHALLEREGPPSPVLVRLRDRIAARYPCISSLTDEQIENSVWHGPLDDLLRPRGGILNISYSRAKEVLPFLIESARQLNLFVIDLSAQQIYRPGGLVRITLTIENRPPLPAPTMPQILSAADALTSNGGPGFLILDGRGDDYAQVAGGDGRYTVEWREYSGSGFRHFVAAVPQKYGDREVEVNTNGCYVTVLENEVVSLDDVKHILRAYAEDGPKPVGCDWHDISRRFQE